MNTKTTVIVKLQVEGAHYFAKAKELFPTVGFLADRHRHIFHIKLSKEVFHDDRDIEFIMFKREVKDYLELYYHDEVTGMLEFDNMSCEAIARELLEYFHCEWVEVWEDDENGARVEKI
jgi:hypothetical protein